MAAPSGSLARLSAQVARFATVGLLNTAVDFLAFNVLLWMRPPQTAAGLAVVAALAALLASANSYLLNARWTFRNQRGESDTAVRFAAFALLGIAVQTGTALFVSHLLLPGLSLPAFAAANLAKLAAVAAAVAVTFAGYRIAVFTPPSLREFRRDFCLAPADQPLAPVSLLLVLSVALVARLVFVQLAPVAYGDAVSYSWVAWSLGHGSPASADSFWHSLFDYWEAALVWIGLSQYPALVIASLVPGLLMIVPAMLLAARLYGNTVSLVAGMILALHPRLVEYSVNGYAETFFLHASLWALWGATRLIGRPNDWRAAAALGAGAAAWVLVRNEALPLALLLLAVPLLLQQDRPRWRVMRSSVLAMVVACVTVTLTLAVDAHFFGKPQLFAKAANASRSHVEMLDPVAAARETYSTGAAKPAAADTTSRLRLLVERWPRNLVYTLERLPGVLLSPLFLAALLLPALVRRRASAREEWPLLAFALWPLLFYPLLQLEPRMLFPVLIGVAIFGAAGLVAIGRYLSLHFGRVWLGPAPVLTILSLLALLVAPLALRSETTRGPHRDIGRWLEAHVPANVAIYGDGYGYVAASSFWSGRHGQPRPWSESDADLGKWLAHRGPAIMLVYDGFRREFNPGLALPADGRSSHMTRLATLRFGARDSVEVWAEDAATRLVSQRLERLAAAGAETPR